MHKRRSAEDGELNVHEGSRFEPLGIKQTFKNKTFTHTFTPPDHANALVAQLTNVIIKEGQKAFISITYEFTPDNLNGDLINNFKRDDTTSLFSFTTSSNDVTMGFFLDTPAAGTYSFELYVDPASGTNGGELTEGNFSILII